MSQGTVIPLKLTDYSFGSLVPDLLGDTQAAALSGKWRNKASWCNVAATNKTLAVK